MFPVIILLVFGFTSSAVAQSRVEVKEHAQMVCESKGLTPGTDEFRQCMKGRFAHEECTQKGLSPGSPEFNNCMNGQQTRSKCSRSGPVGSKAFRHCMSKIKQGK